MIMDEDHKFHLNERFLSLLNELFDQVEFSAFQRRSYGIVGTLSMMWIHFVAKFSKVLLSRPGLVYQLTHAELLPLCFVQPRGQKETSKIQFITLLKAQIFQEPRLSITTQRGCLVINGSSLAYDFHEYSFHSSVRLTQMWIDAANTLNVDFAFFTKMKAFVR